MTSADDESVRTNFAGILALSSRSAGYAVAQKCLEVQAEAEARDPSLKATIGTKLDPEAWSWYAGAIGEMEVGRLLSALGPEWFIRHSVPIGAGTKDVDHLVIGPGGVFAINTKNHRGASVWVGDYAMKVNAATKYYVSHAKGDGLDVSRRLETKVGFPVLVTSVVAVLNQRSLKDDRAPENRLVRVVDARDLVTWLTARPRILDMTTLRLIELAAAEPETWHIDPRAADTFRIMSRFERLVLEVGTPAAPLVTPQRAQPRRNPRAVAARPRMNSTRPAGRSRQQAASLSDLVKLWFATGIIIVALFMLRGYADQPCTSAIGCTLPAIYMGLKPLLILAGVAAIAVGIIGTLVMALRGVRR